MATNELLQASTAPDQDADFSDDDGSDDEDTSADD